MAVAAYQPQPMSVLQRHSGPSGLADVLDVILDKGIVIDVFVRVALVGIELLTIDARIVIASVDTYLHFAEAVNRLDLTQVGQQQTLPEMVEGLTESGAGMTSFYQPSKREPKPPNVILRPSSILSRSRFRSIRTVSARMPIRVSGPR